MKIRHFEARRYFIAASKGPEEYLADLDENKGAGKCSCPDYSCRVQTELDAGRPGRDCKHLAAARHVDQHCANTKQDPAAVCELVTKLTA